MISLNLISSKKKITKKRNIFSIVVYVLFGVFTTYFVFNAVFVAINLYTTSSKLNTIKKESANLSTQILKDNEKLNNFVLSKFILTEINKLKSSKFQYKSYLDQIVTLLPTGNELRSVSFEKKGEVEVSVVSINDQSFKFFESNMRDVDLTDTDFSSIVSKSVKRSLTGDYRTDLIFIIKQKNAGK